MLTLRNIADGIMVALAERGASCTIIEDTPAKIEIGVELTDALVIVTVQHH